MSQNFPEDLTLGYGLVALCQATGARSSWLQKGTALIDSNLPFAESRIERMALIIDEMATSYAHVGREMETLFFGFETIYLIAVCERSLRVILVFPADQKEPPLTNSITAARRFLRKNRPKILSTFEATQAIFLQPGELGELPDPAPSPTPIQSSSPTMGTAWGALFPELKKILSKKLSDEQISVLVKRVLKARGQTNSPSDEESPFVARDIFRKIAVPSIREELSHELEELLEK